MIETNPDLDPDLDHQPKRMSEKNPDPDPDPDLDLDHQHERRPVRVRVHPLGKHFVMMIDDRDQDPDQDPNLDPNPLKEINHLKIKTKKSKTIC